MSTSYESCVANFDFTFRVDAVRRQAESLASHSWEYGTAAEAVMELVDPEKSVFAADPFPGDEIPTQNLQHLDPAVEWVYQKIRTDGKTLFDDSWGVSDPAALGVMAVMTGQRWKRWLDAAERQKDYLLQEAPRYGNGAISHRQEVAELWSDAVHMFPPFLAYYGVHKQDMALIEEAVRQAQLYRDVLSIREGHRRGLWRHIVGPSDMADEGSWATGDGWAAYGMARVRATISGWRPSNEAMQDQIRQLDQWIGEILDGAIRTDDDEESGLLRNYLGDDSWFGETSGTALLAGTAYRMAVLRPDVYAQEKYLGWAHAKRRAVAERVDDDGFAYPAVNPLKHASREPINNSPEGASFILMMGSAWRDCVCRGICPPSA
ncbi:Uu.00g144020.m01.CDS01 [Anthostomella pinea]|uniref:Uu.00g144020.m01.CDS01 n=1 Tax=Anthostomella pinea TaxID=933095 RepID=A0AAI8YJB6_9PEZI|nr:Uu.00g144020.m01.CDS01 [Anthostomella pinea]